MKNCPQIALWPVQVCKNAIWISNALDMAQRKIYLEILLVEEKLTLVCLGANPSLFQNAETPKAYVRVILFLFSKAGSA